MLTKVFHQGDSHHPGLKTIWNFVEYSEFSNINQPGLII